MPREDIVKAKFTWSLERMKCHGTKVKRLRIQEMFALLTVRATIVGGTLYCLQAVQARALVVLDNQSLSAGVFSSLR